MDWKPGGDDYTRKLSSLRFIAQSFQRHLERTMALKEQNGYMANAVERMPNLATKVQTLLEEHDQFEATMHRLVLQLENLSPTDKAGVDAACRELEELFVKLDEHDRREAKLRKKPSSATSAGKGSGVTMNNER